MGTGVGIGLLLALVHASSSSPWAFAPGLLLIGLGLGVMLTPSVNIVQGAFPEDKQGEISGLSRSISNLGSSFGTAIAGTILVSNLASGNGTYVAAMVVLIAAAVAGFGIASRLPANRARPRRAIPRIRPQPEALSTRPPDRLRRRAGSAAQCEPSAREKRGPLSPEAARRRAATATGTKRIAVIASAAIAITIGVL